MTTDNPKPKQSFEFVAKFLSTSIREYLEGGPNRREECLALAFEEFPAGSINGEWDYAEKQRPKPALFRANGIPASFKRRDLSGLRPKVIEAKATEIKSEPTDDIVEQLATKAGIGIPRTNSANKIVYSKALTAPENKTKALVKFNPIKNPYNQNGFENARIALDMMKFECGLDLFHNKPVIMGEHAWLGATGLKISTTSF